MKVKKMGDKWGVEFWYPRAAVVRQTGKQPSRYRWRLSENKREAERQAFDIEASIRDNSFPEKYLNPKQFMTLRTGIEWYLKEYVPGHIDAEKNRRDIARNLMYFLEIIGDKPIDQIGYREIEKYKTARLARVGKSSINRELGTITGLFSRLARYEIIPFNPITGKIEQFQVQTARRRIAAPDEIRKVFSSISDPEFWMITFLGMTTGIRLSDICAIKISNIDWNLGIIDFTQGKVRKRSKKADAVIPLTSMVKSVLAGYIERLEIKDSLFTIGPDIFSMRWSGFVRSLGFAEVLQFRDLRRTFATMCRGVDGIDGHLIAELLGHSSMAMAQEHYIVTQIEQKRQILEQKDEVLKDIIPNPFDK